MSFRSKKNSTSGILWSFLICLLPAPQVFDELAEASGDLSLHAQRVVLVDVLLVIVVLEVLGYGWCVGKALQQIAVHVILVNNLDKEEEWDSNYYISPIV